MAVTTVEGIGSTRTVLHPVQERLAECHGTQCGFCSPGMVMSMYALLRNTSKPTIEQIQEAIQGNLCRCTGYRPILDSFKTFSVDQCPLGEKCCQNQENKNKENIPEKLLYDEALFRNTNSSQEIIFPNELQTESHFYTESLVFKNSEMKLYRPSTLQEALELMDTAPDSEWCMGHVQYGLHADHKANIISVGHLPELNGIKSTDKYLSIGAGTTLTELENFLHEKHLSCSGDACDIVFDSLAASFENWTSGCQIKNVSTIGGNVMSGKTTSNFVPMFMILNAKAVFINSEGKQSLPIDNEFVQNLKTRKPSQLLTTINILMPDHAFVGRYHASQQSHIDGRSAIASVVFSVQVDNNKQISNLNCAFTGLNNNPTIYKNISSESQWNGNTLESFDKWFHETVVKDDAAIKYEATVILNFFRQFQQDLEIALQRGISSGYVTQHPSLKPSHSSQIWEQESSKKSVGHPIPHQWAIEHTTGEAKFVMDMPQYKEELYMVLVTSTKAHANILSIDATNALDIPDVVDFISHKDIPGVNGLTMKLNEECFVTNEVTHIGHIIGGVVAETMEAAKKGARAVVVQYEELPVIISIKDAIKNGSFCLDENVMECGDVDSGFSSSEYILDGETNLGGQEHYYMETQCALVVPKQEYSQFDVYSATQNPNLTQFNIAALLGVPSHKINVHTRRIGGGFGGKEYRSILCAAPAAIAAYKHNKPVRIAMDRYLDMQTTGGRHPCYAKYKVGFNKDGKLIAFACDLYLNAGDTTESTQEVMANANFQIDNCTKIPNFKATARACKTNTASNTAFRGFGIPQSIIMTELCLEKVAKFLNIDFEKVHAINFYKDGDQTHYKQVLENCNIQKCWNLLKETCQFMNRKDMVQDFNRKHTNKKMGIAMIPVKFGLSYGGDPFLSQGAALVNIYTDGSVIVHHGGIEMGQGLNIKLIQIASETLGIPYTKITIDEMTTNTVPNVIPTAASSGTDLFGGAVKNACDKLNERLQSIKDRHPTAKWEAWTNIAFMERVSLSATGYYRPGGIWYDDVKKEGNAFRYFTFGAACSEVELDVLTGEHKLLKTDIVFDIGKSINPAIDVGQIEGGFLQGYSYYCLEELMYSESGKLLSVGPTTYRIPTLRDIPVELNVRLLKEHPNEKAVYSSKGIGEPPLLLGCSAYFAIKDAITAVRRERCLSVDFNLDCPATPKRVLNACNK